MEKNIKTFLESPHSLEFPSEAELKRGKSRFQLKKKQEKLPPFIPFKNIYQETDFSKLTERQKILAIKFKSIGTD